MKIHRQIRIDTCTARSQTALPDTFCITSFTSFMNTFCTNTKWFKRSVVRLCSKEPTCQTKSECEIVLLNTLALYCISQSQKTLGKGDNYLYNI